jgi:methyl-accepting chemotaxis protein
LIVSEIASSSEEQSIAIDQINSGIDQVAQVVQQNSATAEESAAASEEMSGQSNMLEGLISQFKLKGAATSGFQSLPASKREPEPRYSAPEVSDHSMGDFGKY